MNDVQPPKRASYAFLSDARIRSLVFQGLALALVAAATAIVVNNTAANLERQGIASGFAFLDKSAGFDIIQHLIPYDENSTYGQAFVVALLNTLLVSALGIVGSTVLGFVIGVARLSHNWLISRLALAYVEVIRNVPLLLQIFIWYFGVLRSLPSPRASLSLGDAVYLNIRGLYVPRPVPEAGFETYAAFCGFTLIAAFLFVRWARRRQRETGRVLPAMRLATITLVVVWGTAYGMMGAPLSWDLPKLGGFNFQGGLTLLPELVALLLALSIYTAAFIAEIVRAGIQAVGHGQWEAATALGLSRGQALRLVVIPQAMRVIIPPLTSQYLNLTKNSSLAAAIAYPDLVLVFSGTVLMQTGQAVEVVALTMGVYLTISLMISLAMNLYNKRMALAER